MKSLYFECYSGISGDMTVAALLDLGADSNVLIEGLQSLNLDGYEISILKKSKNGIMATDFDVILKDEHEHSRGHHHHRHLGDIFAIIDSSLITQGAKELAKNIFNILAIAEGRVHGCSPMEVHFHEVGAVDSIVDIVGAAICIDNLGIKSFYCSTLFEGTGYVKCQHGLMPVPAPATAGIIAEHSLPLRITENKGEMITPTGAAIIAGLGCGFKLSENIKILKTGIGSGKKDFKQVNILRIHMIEDAECSEDQVVVIQTNIDDSTPETLGYTLSVLMDGGARDVFFTPVYTKKNRPAYRLTLLCDEEKREKLTRLLFLHTSTIGVRWHRENRTVMDRCFGSVETRYGTAKIKHCSYGDISRNYIEYESARLLAEENNLPLCEITAEISKHLDDFKELSND